jgi:hypothetical protein
VILSNYEYEIGAMQSRWMGASPLGNSLKSGRVETQRRVRKKSLYLGDSSDMSHTPDQVRQSIVHVLDAWAKAAPRYHGDERIYPTDWLRTTSDRPSDTPFPRFLETKSDRRRRHRHDQLGSRIHIKSAINNRFPYRASVCSGV